MWAKQVIWKSAIFPHIENLDMRNNRDKYPASGDMTIKGYLTISRLQYGSLINI